MLFPKSAVFVHITTEYAQRPPDHLPRWPWSLPPEKLHIASSPEFSILVAVPESSGYTHTLLYVPTA
jgi:hypothetical protein